jgi:hypothetical protein
MKRREFVMSLPALAGTPSVSSAATAVPVWYSMSALSVQQGASFDLHTLCQDPQGLPLIFAALSALPFGVTLNRETGILSVGDLTAAGGYGVRFRAFNGLAAADSPFLTLRIAAAAAPTPIQNGRVITQPHAIVDPMTGQIGTRLVWINKHYRFATKGDGRVYHLGGDHKPFPGSATEAAKAGYPPSAKGRWSLASGAVPWQDMWMANLTPDSQNRILWELSCNLWSEYGGETGAQKGPMTPDGVGWVFDKRGYGWAAPPYFRDQYRLVDAGVDGTYAGAFRWGRTVNGRWALPARHTNGVRKGNAWHIPPGNARTFTNATGFTGRENGWMTYDPIKDRLLMTLAQKVRVGGVPTLEIRLFEFNCLPNASGDHNWTSRSARLAAMPELLKHFPTITGFDSPVAGSSCLIDRKLYVALPLTLYHPNGLVKYNATGGISKPELTIGRAVLAVVDIDTAKFERLIPLPYKLGGFWGRQYDRVTDPRFYGVSLSLYEHRDLAAIGRKVVIGPAATVVARREDLNLPVVQQLPGDPWVMMYDVDADSWKLGQPIELSQLQLPAGAQYIPTGWGCGFGVPELGEFWVMLSNTRVALPHIRYKIA